VEREQEAMLAKKYGGMLKRKQPLMPKVRPAVWMCDRLLAGLRPRSAARSAVGQATAHAVGLPNRRRDAILSRTKPLLTAHSTCVHPTAPNTLSLHPCLHTSTDNRRPHPDRDAPNHRSTSFSIQVGGGRGRVHVLNSLRAPLACHAQAHLFLLTLPTPVPSPLADWALAKEGKGEQPSVSAEESLPKAPVGPITAHRATSKLEGSIIAPPQQPPAP
jgi:hypothetical protein